MRNEKKTVANEYQAKAGPQYTTQERLNNIRVSETTLRDHFAGLAMQGFLASFGYKEKEEIVAMEQNIREPLSRAAYGMADAMLKARDK